MRYSTEIMGVPPRIYGFLHSRFLHIFVIGGIGFLIQTIVFEILGIYFQLVNPSTAAVLGAEVGILSNFYLNNRFSFHDRQDNSSTPSRLMRFHLVVSGSVLLQYVFVFVAEHQTTNILLIQGAYVAGVILGFIWNYTFYHLFVWRKDLYGEEVP